MREGCFLACGEEAQALKTCQEKSFTRLKSPVAAALAGLVSLAATILLFYGLLLCFIITSSPFFFVKVT